MLAGLLAFLERDGAAFFKRGSSTLAADIVVGRPARLVVKVKRAARVGVGLKKWANQGVRQLENYLPAFPGAFAALVLVGVLPPEATEPHIEHTTTPSGHPVTVVSL